MNFIEPAIFILFLAILSVPIAIRFHLPLEVFLVLGSGIISFTSGLPNFQLDPAIVFKLFLPPILFYAAYFTSWRDFKFNFRPISLLAFGLVIVTTVIVAVVAKFVFPDFTWAEGFLLGAIVSPTDATSATVIIKKLGAPRRLISILEGESLVNDATALLLFRFALIAMLGGSFSLPHAVGHFVEITLGGIALGLLIGIIMVFILPKINSVSGESTLTILTAFICYLAGEHLGVSGIIATVVCGIYFGIQLPQLASSSTRISAKASWNTLMFIINGFVFTVIGLELPLIIQNLKSESLTAVFIAGVIISLAVIITRMAWVYPMAYVPRFFFPSISTKDPMPSWKTLFIISWSGMRGIVSLAAALSIPYYIAPGIAFPHRDLILFVTYCVIAITLLIPSFTLPVILYFFHLKDEENQVDQEALARVQSLENALLTIEELRKKETIPAEVFEDFKRQIQRRLKVIKSQLSDTPYSTLTDEFTALKKLTMAAIESERATLLQLRKLGQIHDEVFHMLSDELDLEETRANTLRI